MLNADQLLANRKMERKKIKKEVRRYQHELKMFYQFATDLLWVVLLEAWRNVEQAAGRNGRKTPTHRKGMEK